MKQLAALLILLLPLATMAQKRTMKKSSMWKSMRWVGAVSLGASNYLGELGGLDQPGSDFYHDMELAETRYVIGGMIGYKLGFAHSVRAGLYYARVRGNDALTAYAPRQERNLHFRSPIIEFSTHYQFHILQPKRLQMLGSAKSAAFGGNRFGLYAFTGIGLFHYNPKARYQDEWMALRPLGTEGQGLEGRPKKYSSFALAIPMGGAITYLIDPTLNLGLEFGLRVTTTDYLDDASTTYYHNDQILAANGEAAAALANPTIATENAENYSAGSPRGNPDSKDSYVFLQLTLEKNIGKIYAHKPVKRKKRKTSKQSSSRDPKKIKRARKKTRSAKTPQEKKLKKFKRFFKRDKTRF